MSAANSLPSSLSPSFVQALLPSFWSFFLPERCEGARVSACRQRLLLPLSLPPSVPLSHCPPLPFSGIRGTNVIHSPARRRRSRSLRPNGQLCKSPVPPPRHPPVDYKHTSLPPPPRRGPFVFVFADLQGRAETGMAFRQSRNAIVQFHISLLLRWTIHKSISLFR